MYEGRSSDDGDCVIDDSRVVVGCFLYIWLRCGLGMSGRGIWRRRASFWVRYVGSGAVRLRSFL